MEIRNSLVDWQKAFYRLNSEFDLTRSALINIPLKLNLKSQTLIVHLFKSELVREYLQLHFSYFFKSTNINYWSNALCIYTCGLGKVFNIYGSIWRQMLFYEGSNTKTRVLSTFTCTLKQCLFHRLTYVNVYLKISHYLGNW
jgi:hypothetical protein